MEELLKLEKDILYINLPQGRTQKELIKELRKEVKKIEFDGLDLKINGRITTGMSLFLGHYLAHLCKSVSIYDPKEKAYIKVISH